MMLDGLDIILAEILWKRVEQNSVRIQKIWMNKRENKT